jgi:hypothetical protein
VSQLSADGGSATIFTGGGLDIPSSLAVDASNNIWVANQGTSPLTQIAASGAISNITGSAIFSPGALATDSKERKRNNARMFLRSWPGARSTDYRWHILRYAIDKKQLLSITNQRY